MYLLTDPVAFLTNLNYRAISRRRHMPAQILQDVQTLLHQKLDVDTSEWMKKHADFSTQWNKVPQALERAIVLLLDIARHLHDALPSYANPLLSSDNYFFPLTTIKRST